MPGRGRRPPERLAACIALALIACAWFWPLLKGDQLTQGYSLFQSQPWAASAPAQRAPARRVFPDAALQTYPWLELARHQLSDGQLPLWNPYEYGGTTLAGNMQSALFFPLTWPLLVVPFGYAWGVVALAKLVVAGLGAYTLSRELRVTSPGALVAAATYMLSSPLMAWLQWPLAGVFCVFPWLLLATTRLRTSGGLGALAGVALAATLTILAGHPESALIALSAAAVYMGVLLLLDLRRGTTSRRSTLGRGTAWLGAIALGAAGAAVALVPFLQALHASVTKSADPLGSSVAHISLKFALQYPFPGLFGNGEPKLYGAGFYNSIALHFGTPALVLAFGGLLLQRRRPEAIALASMALVAGLAMFAVPPVSWFLEHVPPWSGSVVAGRAAFVVALAGAIGAGAALTALLRRPLPLARIALGAAAVGAVALMALVAAQLAGALPAPRRVKLESAGLGVAGIVVGAVVMAAAGRVRPRLATGMVLAAVLVGVVGLRDLNVILPPKRAYPERPQAVNVLQRQRAPFRIAVDRVPGGPLMLPPNGAVLYRLEGIEGYDFPLSRRWSDFQTRVLRFTGLRPESRLASGLPAGARLSALRAMNVRYYVAVAGARRPAKGFSTLYRGRDATVFEDRLALPRAYVVPFTRALPDSRAVAALRTGDLDPRRQAIVRPGSPEPGRSGGAFRAARVRSVSSDHVRVGLSGGGGGWLVLANAYSPLWRAKVDGRSAKVRPTNFAAMGLPVAPGARTVDFRLDRSGLGAGAVISGVALVAMAGLAAIGRQRERRGA